MNVRLGHESVLMVGGVADKGRDLRTSVGSENVECQSGTEETQLEHAIKGGTNPTGREAA